MSVLDGCLRMAIINRCAVAIGPRQPMIDWIDRICDGAALRWEANDEGLYLITAYEDDEEAWKILESVYERIFDQELESWCTDPMLWPNPRSFSLFQQWFEIRFHPMIEDLCGEELCREEIEPGFVAALRAALGTLPPGEAQNPSPAQES